MQNTVNQCFDVMGKQDKINAFETAVISCLFEIAGNLDTIAVEMRKQTKIQERSCPEQDSLG